MEHLSYTEAWQCKSGFVLKLKYKNQKTTSMHLLIDNTVDTKNPIQEKVEEASEDATNYSKDYYCNDILGAICRDVWAKIKHNQPSLPK